MSGAGACSIIQLPHMETGDDTNETADMNVQTERGIKKRLKKEN
jgi:hypothetical protein